MVVRVGAGKPAPIPYMEDVEHLLIDGKNSIYRAIFAGYYDSYFKSTGHDYAVILIRFLSNYINLLKPKAVHVFWDAPRNEVWRRGILPYYKEHRVDKYKDLGFNIREELKRQLSLAILFFQDMNCRQYYVPAMEADDLIYAFCSINNGKTVIVSSDGDFQQIPYKYGHVSIYNPLSKDQQVLPKPSIDVIVTKALMGDKSDNLIGYYNVGEVRSREMAEDPKKRQKFLDSDKAVAMIDGELVHVGHELFNTNRKLIDLSLCPYLADNSAYVEAKQFSPVKFNRVRIEKTIMDNKVRGLKVDLPRYLGPFQNLTAYT